MWRGNRSWRVVCDASDGASAEPLSTVSIHTSLAPKPCDGIQHRRTADSKAERAAASVLAEPLGSSAAKSRRAEARTLVEA